MLFIYLRISDEILSFSSKSIDFFDLYQGENIEPNKKSLAIKVVFEPKNETLKDQDIENFCNDIVFSLKSLGGSLRS